MHWCIVCVAGVRGFPRGAGAGRDRHGAIHPTQRLRPTDGREDR